MMQKVLINCQTLQKDDIFHILNLLTKLMHNYSQNQQHEVFVCVCHKISFYG